MKVGGDRMIAASPLEAAAEARFCAGCGVELTRSNRSCPHVFLCRGCEARELEDVPPYLGD